MLESAARELERLNALSPNAKEFVPRSTAIDTSTVETTPKFLTPKCGGIIFRVGGGTFLRPTKLIGTI
jgi:hypothetical protein